VSKNVVNWRIALEIIEKGGKEQLQLEEEVNHSAA
jgi:hypothetical protein